MFVIEKIPIMSLKNKTLFVTSEQKDETSFHPKSEKQVFIKFSNQKQKYRNNLSMDKMLL